MSRGPDAGTLLHRALIRDAAARNCIVELAHTDMTRWASATFVGAQHRMTVRGAEAAALDAWLTGLAEADLPVRGHLVADVSVVDMKRERGVLNALIEALTVEV